MSKKLLVPFLFLLLSCGTTKPVMQKMPAPTSTDTSSDSRELLDILAKYPQYFDTLLRHNDRYQIKIIYTRIDRDEKNQPSFTSFTYNIHPDQYFYPASTVKMPGALLALQKINELNIPGLTKDATMITDAAYPGQVQVYNDPLSADGRPTVAQYIKRIFLVSDNDAFNRIYEFLGQEYFNNTLHRMGYDGVQVLHRLNISLPEDQNRATNPVRFYDANAQLLYSQGLVKSTMAYQKRNDFLGTGYYSNGSLVNKPFDFSRKNRLPLADLNQMLRSVLFPESVAPAQRFNLTPADYSLVYKYMSMHPGESDYPYYDSSYQDAYAKLLLYGGKGSMEPGLRIFNKEGDAYGFLTDAAYIVDFRHGVEFMLTANISCNTDGIYNDDKYDYDNIGYPFLKNLGNAIYQEELKRPKKHLPDLSRFKMDYSK